jgi:tetratricopeptide (TPR) repeat protein
VEPIGTVTNFYPFLSEDIRTIVESILKQAEGYDDLVSKMVDIVLTQDDTNDLSYLTTILAWISINPVIFNRLRPRLLRDNVLKPWSYWHFKGPSEEFPDEFQLSFKQALESSPKSWVRLYLLLLGALTQTEKYERKRALEESKELIESKPELNCFSSEIHIRQGWFDRFEADIKGAMSNFETAQKIAERYDDVIKRYDAQCDFARCLKDSDVFQALSLLEDAYQAFKSIGANYWAVEIAGNMGLLHTIIGEYDLAAEFYLEADRITEASDRDKRTRAYVFTCIYCGLDLPEKALEWIKYFMDWEDLTSEIVESLPEHKTSHHPFYPPFYLSLAVARTLIELNRLEGVSQLLDKTHKLVMETGMDDHFLMYKHVNGLFEVANGNPNAGHQIMVDALAEAERLGFQVIVNDILLSLTKAELKYFDKLGSGGTESSGPSMTRLGILAQERNYPGIRMQHALLKAEYQTQIGEAGAAQLTLKDALTFTDSPGVKTLRERILKRLDELENSNKA